MAARTAAYCALRRLLAQEYDIVGEGIYQKRCYDGNADSSGFRSRYGLVRERVSLLAYRVRSHFQRIRSTIIYSLRNDLNCRGDPVCKPTLIDMKACVHLLYLIHIYVQGEPNWQDAFWGENYPRLLAIKMKYDPTGVLTCRKCVGDDVFGN